MGAQHEMNYSGRIVTLDLSAPEVLGLRHIFENFNDVEFVVADDSTSLSLLQHADLIIVSSSALINNLDFFLLRKEKVAVLADASSLQNSIFRIIDTRLPESVFIERCQSLLVSADPSSSNHSDLSSRELDVLRELAKGLTNKEIADNLFISVNTVITHRKNISSKLGIRSASGLSLYAVMNGLT